MASFSLSGSVDDLTTPDDLWALFNELVAQGYRGLLSIGPDGMGGQAWSMEAHVDDADSPTGTRTVKAALGYKKVTIGDSVSVMTADAFAATYGTV